MRHSSVDIPLRLILGLMFVGCVEADRDEGPASGLQVPGAPGAATTDAPDATGAPDGTAGPCAVPHDSSTGTTGAESTAGDDTGAPEPGDSGDDDGESSDPGDGETGGDETGAPGEPGGSTGGSGDADESTGDGDGSTGDADESTGGSGESTGGGEGDGPSFAGEVWPIFDDNCGCHTDSNGAGKLKLAQDVAYDQMVGQPSNQLPTMMLVEPGSSETSYLWHKLADTHKSVGGKGKVMPPGGELGTAELEVVKQWIDGGAKP